MRPQINIMWVYFYAGVYLRGCAAKYAALQIQLYWGLIDSMTGCVNLIRRYLYVDEGIFEGI